MNSNKRIKSINNKKTQILYINIPWMEKYCGATEDDLPRGGFGFTKKDPWSDHTQFNFKPYKKKLFGSVPGSNNPDRRRFTSNKRAEYTDNITVVWIASHPEFHKKVIVGWFTKARVWFKRKEAFGQLAKKRITENEGSCGYSIECLFSNSKLIKSAHRPLLPKVIRIGRSPFGYGSIAGNSKVLKIIRNSKKQKNNLKSNSKSYRGGRLHDAIEKKQIELKAMDIVMKKYDKAGYYVEDRSAQNKGYDIFAKSETGCLYLEVKGSKGAIVNLELTPNEYNFAKKNRKLFRICSVLSTLEKLPKIHILKPGPKCMTWLDENKNVYFTNERVAANISK